MTPSSTPFRLGLIGTGAVARLHLEGSRDLPEVTFAAICDIREEHAIQVAAEFGGRAFSDYRTMLDTVPLDGVIITSPHLLHAEMVRAAALAGVAVLVEKPMATTVEDATSMIDACEIAGVPLVIGHVLHFDEGAKAAEEVLRTGRLGRVVAITYRRSSHYGRGSRPDWFFDPRMAGGGIAMNVGTHGLDRIQWLGGGRIAEVSASVWNRGGLPVETDAIATMRLDNGVVASVVLTSAEVPYTDETIVLCEGGSLRITAGDGAWVSDGGAEERIAEASDDPVPAFAAQLDHFVHTVRGGSTPSVDGDYGRSVVAAVLAIYESSTTGRVVSPKALTSRMAA
jgi:predicted dehydrogenase